MRNVMILSCLLFAGCASDPAVEAWKLALREADSQILSTTTATHDVVKENTAALKEIKASIESLEASLVKSEAANSQEVIQESKAEPSDKNANDSQPAHGIVAESEGSVSSKPYLQVWSASYCVYCPATLKAAREVAKEFGISCVSLNDQPKDVVEKCEITAYPTITLCRDGLQVARLVAGQNKESLRAWLREQGLKPVEFPQAKATPQAAQTTTQDLVALHDSIHNEESGMNTTWSWPGGLAEHLRNTHGVMVDGSGPYYSGNQVVSSRNVVRSVSRGPVVNWRSRGVSRASCPTGTCPR